MLQVLALVAFVVLALQARTQPRSSGLIWLLGLYSMGVPFASALRTGLPAPIESVSSVLGTLAVAMLARRIIITGRIRPVIDVHVVLWLLVASLVMASALRTADGAAAWSEVVALAGLASLYLLATLVGMDRFDLLLIQRATALGGAVLGALASFQAVTGTLPAGQSGVQRFEVPWSGGDPNITAASLVLPLALAAHLERTDEDGLHRWIDRSCLVLTFAAIALTSSRAGLAVGAVIVLHHLYARRRVGLALGLVAAAGVPAYLAWASFGSQVSRLDSTGRAGVWITGWSQCAEWCSSGAGLGAFPAVHRDGALAGVGPVPTKYGFEAHSTFLQVLIESGAVTAALLVTACVATLWSIGRAGGDSRTTYLLAFAGVVTTNVFLSNFSFKYFWLVIMHAAWAVGVERSWASPTTADGDLGRRSRSSTRPWSSATT